MRENQAVFRFYEELNDFLPRERIKTAFAYRFNGNPSIKDAIEALGVPHAEVDMILVNGRSVDFTYQLRDGDAVSVYPVFEFFDITGMTHVRPKPLREPKFILDVHLGVLAKYLRLLGFDTLYRNDYTDGEIIDISIAEGRIICTRDVGLLKVKTVTHGYWVRSQDTKEQVKEVVRHFDIFTRIDPFNRCIKCNGPLVDVAKHEIQEKLESGTRNHFDHFRRCRNCGSVFWKGSHFDHLQNFLRGLRKELRRHPK